MVIVVRKKLSNKVQVLDEGVCISIVLKPLRKGMNPQQVFHQLWGNSKLDWTLDMAASLEGKPAILSLKIDLVSHSTCGGENV